MYKSLKFGFANALLLAVACSGSTRPAGIDGSGGTSNTCRAGSESCACYGDGTCDGGLDCQGNLCLARAIASGGTNTGGMTYAGGGASTGSAGSLSAAGNTSRNGGTLAANGGTTSIAGRSTGGSAGAVQPGTSGTGCVAGAANVEGSGGSGQIAGNVSIGGFTMTAGAGGSFAAASSSQLPGTASGGAAGMGGTAGGTNTKAPCVVYVNAASGDDGSLGTAWVTAMATVPGAIDRAKNSGCDVWVAAGTYKPTPSAESSVSIVLSKNLGLYGGFRGTETDLSQRDFAANVTVLDGDIGEIGNSNDNTANVVIGAEGATLDGFTVTGGAGSAYQGGGILNRATGFTVSNCIVTGNIATENGAGISSEGASFVLRDSVIRNNSAPGSAEGVGVYISGNDSLVERCAFRDNTVGANGSAALSVHDATGVVISNSEFSGNVGANGGGLEVLDASVLVANSRFFGNRAKQGGAISLAGYPSLRIVDCVFDGNSALTLGGAIYAQANAVDVERCIFTANTAVTNGGAIASKEGQPASRIANSIFFGNSTGSANGGAIAYGDGTLSLISTTIASNNAGTGGGIYAVDGIGHFDLLNTILWDNTPDDVRGGTVTASYTITSGAALVGTGNFRSDPLFVNLASGDLRLRAGSPALDAGTTAGAPALDLLGKARDSAPDIGAYEGVTQVP